MTSTVITAALNGATIHRAQCPNVPYSPQEIADEAQRAFDAGASVVHVFAREDGGGVTYRPELYRDVFTAIRAQCPVLISVDTSLPGVPLHDRLAALSAGPDLATISIGSMSVARLNENADQVNFDYDHAYSNPFSAVVDAVENAGRYDVKAIYRCHDLGHVGAALELMDAHVLAPPAAWEMTLGVLGGIGATAHNLCRLVESLPKFCRWHVSPHGANHWPMCGATLSLGGSLKVGFETCFHGPRAEVAKSNGELVTHAQTLIRAFGFEPATVQEASEQLMGS
jgi:3-keto-5-aminohexanoate cleavage enzyme